MVTQQKEIKIMFMDKREAQNVFKQSQESSVSILEILTVKFKKKLLVYI